MVKSTAVSIVVPVYNVERYLDVCLDSLLAQTLKDIEIICVDDGSTDGSPAILKDYQKKDSRINIITKPNTGYGDSMNRGFNQACGEYLGIVESDDFVDPTMFQELYSLAKANNADLVKGDYFEYQSTEEPHDCYFRNLSPQMCGKVFAPIDDQRAFSSNPAIWSALYRRGFLEENDINFLPTPGASYQDTSFNFKVLARAKRALYINKAHLHYRIDNEGSSVKAQNKVFCVCEEYAEVERFLAKQPETQIILAKREQPVKFSGYTWNLDRLSDELQLKFYERFLAEFQQAEKQGLIERKYFDDLDWGKLTGMLEDPQGYFQRTYGDPSDQPSLLKRLQRRVFGV